MRTMLDSKAAKSRRTSSCHFWRSVDRRAASSLGCGGSSADASDGGVGGAFEGGKREMEGLSRRLVIRLKGFSSTLRRRRLWRASASNFQHEGLVGQG